MAYKCSRNLENRKTGWAVKMQGKEVSTQGGYVGVEDGVKPARNNKHRLLYSTGNSAQYSVTT